MLTRLLIMFSAIMLFMTNAFAMEMGGYQAKVKIHKESDGAWQLKVDGQPYFIKGVVFSPVKIGESPGEGTMRDWLKYDDDRDGRNDIAFQTWLDINHNNRKDKDELAVGDFQLLKDLGINTIRLYHVPSDNLILGDIYKKNSSTQVQYDHPINKTLLRKLYSDYGIRVIMGNFLGSWTIGSGASWDEGTDYTNAQHRENIIKSVKAMVLDSKDEPYVLMWYLGNENNIAEWSKCNAKQEPVAYAKLIGELVQMIHSLDPNHPVAVSIGDSPVTAQFLQNLAQYASGVDIIAYNAYKGKDGFEDMWAIAKKNFDRPVFISEFGAGAYNAKNGEDQDWQNEYIRGCWKDIVLNSSGYYGKNGQGNSIGGVVFDWVDRWYMNDSPSQHNGGTNPGVSSDGLGHEEWFGVMSMGDGSDTLMRQERKICDYLKKTWNKKEIVY